MRSGRGLINQTPTFRYMSTHQRIREFYSVLYEAYGSQGWWPGEDTLEIILGAILTQNTSWKNAKKAIDNLKREGLISVEGLRLISLDELAQLIRPSGYYNQKAVKVKNFIGFLVEEYGGDLGKMLSEDTKRFRSKLLRIRGIGPETADSILLYAAKRPVFVVDTYTYRILLRHNLIGEETTYEEIQNLFMDSLPQDTGLFNEYHALLVKLGKERCRKKPICKGCPLEYDPHNV